MRRPEPSWQAGKSLLRFAPLGLILALLVTGLLLGWHRYLTLDYLVEIRTMLIAFSADHGWWAAMAYVIVYAIAVAVAFPATWLLTLAGGFLYGMWFGGLLAAMGATIGATILFWAARTAFGKGLRSRVEGFAGKVARGFENNAFIYLLALRLAPVLPFAIVNIVPALFKIPLATYVTATMLGILPGALVYATIGQGLETILADAAAKDRGIGIGDLVTPSITLGLLGLALLAAIAPLLGRIRTKTGLAQGQSMEATLHAQQNISCDVCVIGAGSAGLSAASGAAQLGAKVVLIERGAMGGDCLNTGCVPSKSLVAAAHAAHIFTAAMVMGVGKGLAPKINFEAVHGHVHGVINSIAPNDSVERFQGMGITVIKDTACFVNPTELVAGNYRITARRFVIATGSRPMVPPVPGLREADPLTNETIFDLTERPDHLLILGGGPVGLEIAQAFRRLGSAVTIVDRGTILRHDEPEAAELIRSCLGKEGIVLHEHANLLQVARIRDGITATIEIGTKLQTVAVTHVLVAAGREANVQDMGLELARVEVDKKGIEVDSRLRTSNHRIYALGDVAGGPQFTHIAGYHAGIFVRNAMFGLPTKADYAALPWVTYLDPEVAHVGLTEADAKKNYGKVTVIIEHMSENDRAQTERRIEGFIKLILNKRGKVLGATIVAPHAGEMIGMWGLVIAGGVKLSAVASMIAPYPTMAEISKRAASSYYKPKLFGKLPRAWVSLVQKMVP